MKRSVKSRPPQPPEPARPATWLANRYYGLQGQEYPFRPRPGHPEDFAFLRDEAEVVLNGIQDMIFKRVRTRLSMSGIENSDQHVEAVVQECREKIWIRLLPGYSTKYKTKLTTYLYDGIGLLITTWVRDFRRAQKRNREHAFDMNQADRFEGTHGLRGKPPRGGADNLGLSKAMSNRRARDEFQDDSIEKLAADIMAHPEKYLTKRQVKVFNRIIQQPTGTTNEMSDELGYSRDTSLYMMIKRIRERIKSLSIEDANY